MAKKFVALKRGWFWTPFSRWRVGRRGTTDGQLEPPVPPWGAVDQPPFVMEIKRAGDGDLQLITLGWDREDRELKGRYSEADRHLEHCRHSCEEAERHHTAAVTRYEQIHRKPAPTTRNKAMLFYGCIALLIAIFEIPLNLSFFRLFGESEILTLVATIGLAFSLMFCAHYLGLMLREGARGLLVRKILIGCMIAFPALLIAGIAFLRVAYIHQVDETARTINPTVLLVVSAALNGLMVTVATVAAYVLHEEGRAEVDHTRKALQRAVQARNQAEKQMYTLAERRRKIFDSFKTQAQHIKDVAEGLVEAYRTANLQKRQDRGDNHTSAYPLSFLQEVIIKIPMPLRAPEPPPLGSMASSPLNAAPGMPAVTVGESRLDEVG